MNVPVVPNVFNNPFATRTAIRHAGGQGPNGQSDLQLANQHKMVDTLAISTLVELKQRKVGDFNYMIKFLLVLPNK